MLPAAVCRMLTTCTPARTCPACKLRRSRILRKSQQASTLLYPPTHTLRTVTELWGQNTRQILLLRLKEELLDLGIISLVRLGAPGQANREQEVVARVPRLSHWVGARRARPSAGSWPLAVSPFCLWPFAC